MKFCVTSDKGHHEAVLEVEVAEKIFNKMTGKNNKALPLALKEKIPDTLHDLEQLWSDTPIQYTPMSLDSDGNLIDLSSFNPQAAEVLFFAPQCGG